MCNKTNLEGLGDDDIALGPHLEVKTCHQTLDGFQPKPVTGLPLSVVLVPCRRLQDLLVLQGTTKSTRNKTNPYAPIKKILE